MTPLMPFKTLPCANTATISQQLYDFAQHKVNLSDLTQPSWRFVNSIELLQQAPALAEFFKQHRLYLRDSAFVVLYDTMPLHVDAPPVIAKINFPVVNGQGWRNAWYHVDSEVLLTCPDCVDDLGFANKDISHLDINQLREIDSIDDLDEPVVFNSAIPHTVIKTTANTLPRVVASFTFHNQPLEQLK